MMNKELEQTACDFAGDRSLGAEHGYPSFEANLLERGFIAGATSKYVEKQKLEFAIKQLKETGSLNFKGEFTSRKLNQKIKELEQKLSEL